MTVPACAARGVGYAYPGGGPVLDGIDLEVAPGALHALVGPNGSGKSTLLRLLAGLARPRTGRIELAGRPLAALGRAEVARRVALVPERLEPAFPLSVSEVVLLGRTPHRDRPWFDSAGDLAAARSALEATGSLEIAARPFSALSSGERQRVVLARAFCQDPSLLLLDEPTAHLDLRHQVALLDLLAARTASGLTCLAVLHDLNLAARCAAAVTLLQGGQVVATGPPVEVLTPDRLREVFGVEVAHGRLPGSGAPWFVPVGVAGASGST